MASLMILAARVTAVPKRSLSSAIGSPAFKPQRITIACSARCFARKRALQAHGTVERVGSRREGRHEPIASSLDLIPSVCGEPGARDALMLAEQRPPSLVTEALQELRVSLHVGEQDGVNASAPSGSGRHVVADEGCNGCPDRVGVLEIRRRGDAWEYHRSRAGDAVGDPPGDISSPVLALQDERARPDLWKERHDVDAVQAVHEHAHRPGGDRCSPEQGVLSGVRIGSPSETAPTRRLGKHVLVTIDHVAHHACPWVVEEFPTSPVGAPEEKARHAVGMSCRISDGRHPRVHAADERESVEAKRVGDRLEIHTIVSSEYVSISRVERPLPRLSKRTN